LAKDRERLHRIDAELERDLDEIRDRRSEVHGLLIAAGLVRGLV
jgi:hypothetical protein